MYSKIPEFSNIRVLVVGDVMLDRYWHGATSRISPEAPVPVVHVKDLEERPGGAANVALNIAALGAKVSLLGVVGDDEPGKALNTSLSDAGVDCDFLTTPGLPTVTKLRVLSRHQQLIRLDFEENMSSVIDSKSLLSCYAKLLDEVEVIILSDYGKGTLAPIRELIELGRQKAKCILIDPKNKDFSVYRDASLLTPNMSEFEAIVGVCKDVGEIESKAKDLIKTLNLDAMLVTRGEHGMSLISAGEESLHLPTHAREVFDVTGAGDTVISVLAACLASGETKPTSVHLANIAAGIVVGKIGTAVVSESELRRALKGEQEHYLGVVDEATLVSEVSEARDRDEKIIMTNGCFDILHAGHVSYLEQARKLGDRLIVAVNDDDSVRQLKGDQRPVNNVNNRMTVLAGLASVDWVLPFSEETPERLICHVLPDILVKGGDYKAEDVAGYHCLLEKGHKVEILQFLEDCSTSNIIKKIRQMT